MKAASAPPRETSATESACGSLQSTQKEHDAGSHRVPINDARSSINDFPSSLILNSEALSVSNPEIIKRKESATNSEAVPPDSEMSKSKEDVANSESVAPNSETLKRKESSANLEAVPEENRAPSATAVAMAAVKNPTMRSPMFIRQEVINYLG